MLEEKQQLTGALDYYDQLVCGEVVQLEHALITFWV
jgi:hypothetical protein